MSASRSNSPNALDTFGVEDEKELWQDLQSLGDDQQIRNNQQSAWATALRHASANRISLVEQIRLSQFERHDKKRAGPFRMFDLNHPLPLTRSTTATPQTRMNFGRTYNPYRNTIQEE